MVACRFCEVEMNGSASCTAVPVVIKAGTFDPVPYGSERRLDEVTQRCHDCDVLPGGYHHRGCDMEECPACKRQLIGWRGAPSASRGLWSENHFCGRIVVAMTPAVFEGTAVPLLVMHDTDDSWQVLDGGSVEGTEPVVVLLDDITDVDPLLAVLLDLGRGWCAERDDAEGEWYTYPDPDPEDDD